MELRARIGDRDEAISRPVRAEGLDGLLEEVGLEDVGLQCGPRFARDDEQRPGHVQPPLRVADLGRVGRIEHVQRRVPVDEAEGLLQDLRAEARAPHPQQQRMGELLGLRFFSEAFQLCRVLELLFRRAQPPQPARFVRSRPQRRVPCPEPPHTILGLPLLDRGAELGQKIDGKAVALPVDPGRIDRPAAAVHGGEQLVERLDELPHAVLEELVGHLLHRDAGAGEGLHRVGGGLDVLLEARTDPPMVTESIEGGGGDRVDRVASDQLLDVEDVAVARVLRARARPEQPLGLGSPAGEGLPARCLEDLPVALIDELRVGDGDPAEEPLQQDALRRGGGLEAPRHDLVDRGVDPADEEAGHARHPAQIGAPRGAGLQALDVGLGHLLVDLLGEEEGHVDVDPLADELADGRDPLGRGRDLDHGVVPADRLPEPPGLLQGPVDIVREMGRHLEADVAVAPRCPLVDRPQQVGGILDIADRQGLVSRFRVPAGPPVQLLQLPRVVIAAGDGLLEDGGVGRHPFEPVFLDQPFQLPLRDQAPPDVVQPYGLAVPAEGEQRVERCLLVRVGGSRRIHRASTSDTRFSCLDGVRRVYSSSSIAMNDSIVRYTTSSRRTRGERWR